MTIKMPLARGRMSALMAMTMAMRIRMVMSVESSEYPSSQNAKGIERCPVMRMVAQAGPSSARSGVKSSPQSLHFGKGVMYLQRSFPLLHWGQ